MVNEPVPIPYANASPEAQALYNKGQADWLGYTSPQTQPTTVYPPQYITEYMSETDFNKAQVLRWSVQDQETYRQFNVNNKLSYDANKLIAETNLAIAKMTAGSSAASDRAANERATITANAAIEAANIAAAAARFDAETRLQIARETLAVEKSRIFAEEFGQPSQWASQAAFARSWDPAQAEALKVTPPGFLGGDTGGAPALSTAPQTLSGAESAAYGRGWAPEIAQTLGASQAIAGGSTQLGQPVAPQAIVGERGPELATATPQGTVISPLSKRRAQGFGGARMALGGIVKYPQTFPQGTLVTPPKRPQTTETYTRSYNRSQQAPQTTPQRSVVPSYMQLVGGGGGESGGSHVGKNPRLLAAEKNLADWRAANPGVPLSAYYQTLGLPSSAATGPTPPAISVEPPTPPTTSIDTLFQQMQQPNQAAFGAWTGPTNLPGVGLNQNVKPPWQYNLDEWQELPTAQRAMLAGTWRALGMIPGETEQEKLYYAEEAMRRSAWTGGSQGAVAYGAW